MKNFTPDPFDDSTISKPISLKEQLKIKNITETYKFRKNIGELGPVLNNLLMNENSYNIIADMNSGKTYSIIDHAVKHKINVVLAQPLQINVRQKVKEFEKKGIVLPYIHGPRKIVCREKETINVKSLVENMESTVILCVYNSLPKLLNNKKFDSSKYILVIDEAHLLVTHHGFRYKEINFLIENTHRFRKVLHLTGTPEGTINESIHSIKFTRRRLKRERAKLTIVKYGRNVIYKLVLHILNSTHEGKIIILKDDLMQLHKIKNALIQYGYTPKTIKIISSSNKGSSEFALLEEEEVFCEKLKFILTTRVIAEGANIYGTSDSIVYILDSNDYLMKRQFISRFRDGLKKVYDFLPYNTSYKYDWIDLNNEFLKIRRLLEIQCKTKQKFFDLQKSLDKKNTSKTFIKKSSLFENDDFIYFSETDGQFRVSNERIKWYLIQKLNERISANIFNSISYYREIADYRVNYINASKILLNIEVKPSLKEFREKVNLFKVEVDNSEINHIRNNFTTYFSMFYNQLKKGKANIEKPNEKYFADLSENQNDIEIIKKSMQQKKIYNYFKSVYILFLEEYPIRVILSMFELLYWGRNIKFKSNLMRFNYFHNYLSIKNIPGLKSLSQNSNLFNQYKLTHHVINKIIPNRKYDLYELRKVIEDEMRNLRMDVSVNGFEYSSILNGIFNVSGRKQGKKPCSGQKPKVFYYMEINEFHNENSVLSVLGLDLDEAERAEFKIVHTVRIKSHLLEMLNTYQKSHLKIPSKLYDFITKLKKF